MKSPVTLRIPIPSDWDAGQTIQVYTDRGTGTIDATKPLLGKPKAVFPGAVTQDGFGLGTLADGAFGLLTPPPPHRGGLGDHALGDVPLGDAEPYALVTVDVPAVFARWKFAVKAIDGNGNPQADALVEIQRVVSATQPTPAKSLAYASYNAGTDQVTFNVAMHTDT